MIRRDFKSEEFTITCDDCGESHTHGYSFDEIRAWAKDNGWRALKVGDHWENLCPGCAGNK